MKSQRYLSFVFLWLFALSSEVHGDTAKNSPIKFAEWVKGVHRVDAVLFNYKEDENVNLISDGVFHPGLVKQKTKTLNDTQIRELERCVTNNKPHFDAAGCYWPHHGFVFYGSDDKILGFIEVCLMCGHGFGVPEGGLSEDTNWDLEGIRNLVEKIGLPNFMTPLDWDAYFAELKRVELDGASNGLKPVR